MSIAEESSMPSWAYAHPALIPSDQQSETLMENWRQFQQTALSYNLDPNWLALRAAGCARGDLLLHQHRRRMATRETTGVLRAWLSEHKMNPYPTKGEKIMLAVITTMTLTQVSTWFANARRRLKKENKMTWTPRHRLGEEEDADAEDAEDNVEDDEDEKDEKVTAAAAAAAAVAAAASAQHQFINRKRSWHSTDLRVVDDAADFIAAKEEEEAAAEKRGRPSPNLEAAAAAAAAASAPSKPRIWSIVDTATRVEPPRPSQRLLAAAAAAAAATAATTSAMPASTLHLPSPRLQPLPGSVTAFNVSPGAFLPAQHHRLSPPQQHLQYQQLHQQHPMLHHQLQPPLHHLMPPPPPLFHSPSAGILDPAAPTLPPIMSSLALLQPQLPQPQQQQSVQQHLLRSA